MVRSSKILLLISSLIALGLFIISFFWFWVLRLLLPVLAIAYLIWLGRLVWTIKTPHAVFEKVTARYLLWAQGIVFLLPSAIIGLMILFGVRISFAWISPLIFLFPLSLLIGILPAKKWQDQAYLVQSEKRIAFGDLLGGLAHELNNPLNFVYSSLQPLRDGHHSLKEMIPQPDDKALKVFRNLDQLVTNMEEGVERVKKLIEQFRDFPSGRRLQQKEEIDIAQTLHKCIDLLAHKWKGRLQIEKNFQPIPKILGISLELEQAFTNLLANAFDATPEGGIVRVMTQRAHSGIKVIIQDTGKGIPQEIIGRIFDPFFSTKAQGEGKGLGLVITLQIIKNHKGSIEVKSEVGKGTEFSIFLSC